MKTVSSKVATAVVVALGLTAGVVGMVNAQTTGEIGTTGEDSSNHVNVVDNDSNKTVKHSDVNAENNNPQHATSGSATVSDGDDEGEAMSGEAKNASKLNGGVTVTQTGADDDEAAAAGGDVKGSIAGSGEDSRNRVNVLSNVQTTNKATSNVNVENNNSQSAKSGNATVKGGEDGGKATSGAASNTSDTTFTVTVNQ